MYSFHIDAMAILTHGRLACSLFQTPANPYLNFFSVFLNQQVNIVMAVSYYNNLCQVLSILQKEPI